MWWVNDRSRHQGAEYAAISNREITASQFFNLQFAVTAFYSQFFDFLLDISHTQGIDITQHWGYQTAWGRNRNTDIKVVVVNHIFAINRSIHFRIAFQSFNYRFDIEGHKAQTNTVTLLESFTVLLTQVHDRLHIDFVKRGQHRCTVFRFQQTLSNTFTQTGHGYAFFAAASQCRRCGGSHFGFSHCWCRFTVCQMTIDIFTGNTATHAAAFNGSSIKVMFCNQTTNCRAESLVTLFFQASSLTLRWGGLGTLTFFFRRLA